MFDFKQDAKRIVHMHPYHYSLIHQSPGVPLTEIKGVYMLDEQNEDQSGFGEGGVVGTRFNKGQGGQRNGQNDQMVTEGLLLKLTECEDLSEIRVISLRNQQLTTCLKTLSTCENLTIAYLQGNLIQERDLANLQNFSNLKKLDLSDNNI